jgi:hypothetical protein
MTMESKEEEMESENQFQNGAVQQVLMYSCSLLRK